MAGVDRFWRCAGLALVGGLSLVLGGCARLAPGGLALGTPIAEARHSIVGPTGEYALPNGGTRLEFAQGGFGKRTYMLDFDRSGLLVTSQQVLTEANLGSVAPGTLADDVRMRFGRPVSVLGIGYQKLHVWNYRFDGGDCVWYQISISDSTQSVTQSGIGMDPVCGANGGASRGARN